MDTAYHSFDSSIVSFIFLISTQIPLQETETPPPTQTDKLFQQSLQEFANTIAVADEKYFLLDDKCNLTCLDAETGNFLWQANLGHWRAGGILVEDGIVYFGTGGGVVQAVDEDTGDFIASYASIASITGLGLKSSPIAFSVCDGRVFIEHNGCNAYDIETGEELWKSKPVSMLNPPEMPYTGSVWSFEGKLVLAKGIYPSGDRLLHGIYRIDPDKGTPVWGFEGYFYQEPLVYENKVILPNYGQHTRELCDKIIAVTISSGVKIWSYDVGAPIYKPVMDGDKLLFVSEDGDFYALNLSNGTLAWKTPLANISPSDAGVSPVIVDVENREVFWAYGVTKENGSDSNLIYDCTLFRLNLSTGQNLLKTQFQSNATGVFFTRNNPIIGITLLNNTAYLTVQKDIWAFDKSTLAALKTEHFDYSLLQPIAVNNCVYVSGDLYALAYKDIEK